MPGRHFYLYYNIVDGTYHVLPLWEYLKLIICGMEHNKTHIYQSIAIFESEAEAEQERIKLMQN